MTTGLSRGQKLGVASLFVALAFAIGGLYWWPLTIPAVLFFYFGFMLACFT